MSAHKNWMGAVAFLAFTALAVQTGDARTHETSGVKTVLVLGDSLSEGFRLRPNEAWPALVSGRLRQIDPHFQLVNASGSGSTSANGLHRLPAYLKRPLGIFIVELGINDAFRNATVEEIRANLQAIIDAVKAKNPTVAVIVVGMQFPLAGSDDDYVTAFGKMFGEIAAKNRASYVPYLLAGVAGDPTLNLSDRIHPNAAGHKILAETMWKTLEPIARVAAAR